VILKHKSTSLVSYRYSWLFNVTFESEPDAITTDFNNEIYEVYGYDQTENSNKN